MGCISTVAYNLATPGFLAVGPAPLWVEASSRQDVVHLIGIDDDVELYQFASIPGNSTVPIGHITNNITYLNGLYDSTGFQISASGRLYIPGTRQDPRYTKVLSLASAGQSVLMTYFNHSTNNLTLAEKIGYIGA